VNVADIANSHPADAPALIDGAGQVTSYGELRRAVGAMRARLVQAGIRPDDRVAIVSVNDPAFVVGYLAVVGVGAVAVPLNPASPPAELARELAQVRVSAFVVGPGGDHAGAGLAVAGLPEVPVLGPDPPAAPDPPVAHDADAPDPPAAHGAAHGADAAASPNPPAAQDADAAAHGAGAAAPDPPAAHDADAAADVPPIADRRPDDLAALLFTAGTGGSPRPAMLTHNNLLANIDQVARHPGRATTNRDVIFGVLPLFHIFGLNVLLGGSLEVGAPILLLDRFDARTAIDLIERHQVTILLGAPTMYAALAALPPRDDYRPQLASVRLAFSGAAPLSSEVADLCEQRLGLVIRQGYGLTEASPVVTSSVIDEPPRRGSIGVPIPDIELRIVDDEGEEAFDGDPGEIWVRGPNVFAGYWEDPEATAGVLTPDGWLRTGDVAVAGDDGELYIVDRAKDVIIVSGFNVFPAEVEDVLLEHPRVAEVAVVGVADPYRGEAVHAFVVPAAGHPGDDDADAPPLTIGELMAFTSERLARYKCPTEIILMPSLPHGLGGKLLRQSLRAGTAGTAAT
jgi:long-chain acyl-CoA synthetase